MCHLQAAAYFLRNKETETVALQKNKRKQRTGLDFMPRDEEDQTGSTAQNDNIVLEWQTDEWSKCSQTCGNEGKMVGIQ